MSDLEPTVVTGQLLRDWPLPQPDDDAGKDSRGTIVVVGGAVDTPGAVLLAGLAALRVGAGKLTIATVAPNAGALAVAVPESAVRGLPATPSGSLGADAVEPLIELVDGADAVLIGPGMRGADETRALVSGLLPHLGDDMVLVLDAMGLTCGALEDPGRRTPLVATPNATEAGYLLDEDADGADPGEVAPRLAKHLDAVVALRSTIAAPGGGRWQVGSGDVGLGTSGSGDVLAGAIAGLAARGASADQAAVWGVHLHSEAGARLAARVGRLGFLARELLDELPAVLAQLSQ